VAAIFKGKTFILIAATKRVGLIQALDVTWRTWRMKTALALITGLSLSCSALATGAPREWLFLESAGDYMSLSQQDESIILGEEVFPATFCQEPAMAVCIKSKVMDFAYPHAGLESWTIGPRIFCVTKRFSLDKGDDRTGDFLQISSWLGNSCRDVKSFDEVFIFSRTFGLRNATIIKTDFKAELFSLNQLGLGAAAN
jgi:hypothetical protein